MRLSIQRRAIDMNNRLLTLLLAFALAAPVVAMPLQQVRAEDGDVASDEASPAPPTYSSIMDLRGNPDDADADMPPAGGDIVKDEKATAQANALHIRLDALKEAGLSFGARSGLAHRTFEIQRRLAEQETYLSKTYDFNRLLIPAQNGLLIEPPIVAEAEEALIIKTGGQEAAVADRVLKINRAARIVSASRNWRTYLERDWGKVEPPPALLLPRDKAEIKAWQVSVKAGWDAGVMQADDIFQADLDRLTNDFVGMVRYRQLLAQRMITPPYALAENRGITGNPNEMRIGDRGLEITGPSQFVIQSNHWQPQPAAQ